LNRFVSEEEMLQMQDEESEVSSVKMPM